MSLDLRESLLISFLGIHGRPYQPFDGVNPTAGNAQNGYCTHVSILFPTWHRPYLALFEQVLHGMIQQIAQLWPAGPVRDQYVAAAANFRIPYWDWAMAPPAGESVLPDSVGGSPTMVVDGPNGQQTIANPLYTYQFKPLDPVALPDPPVRFSRLIHRGFIYLQLASRLSHWVLHHVYTTLTIRTVQILPHNSAVSHNERLDGGITKQSHCARVGQ